MALLKEVLQEQRVDVTVPFGLTGTCNVLGADSAVASAHVETRLASPRDELETWWNPRIADLLEMKLEEA